MRIAIVNDNQQNRVVLQHIIDQHPDYTLAWTAKNGIDAIEHCAQDTPDLILMDMIMPDMNGVEACQVIMKKTPCAIIIVTASVTGNAAMVFEAMSYGAIDAVRTPFTGEGDTRTGTEDLLRKIKTVSSLIKSNSHGKPKNSGNKSISDTNDNHIVVLGSSTGGPGALATILRKFPANFPVPVVIVQHVDSSFSGNFATWLNKQSNLHVQIANDGDRPEAGKVFIAGRDIHLVMTNDGVLTYSNEPEKLIYKPSVDVFFNSVNKQWQGSIIAALLTGMGKDGAQGLASIHQSGGHTITQTKETCAVYGMPKAADEMGVVTESLAPDDIANSIIKIVYGNNYEQ